ncbi:MULTISPECIES: DNRLRE domain-containing protein [Sporomusa]|uniref:DNRLRE domain-containing protein n=1 Tax=Sporomusa TaxID=2375 RepID=UPI00315902F7
MSVINILASKSLTVSTRRSRRGMKGKKIIVGNKRKCNYFSYLFFDTSAIPNSLSLLSAKLVLFKLCDFFSCTAVTFSVYPLLDQFSSYTTYDKDCSVSLDPTLKQDFFPFTCEAAIEIDITTIVDMWLKNTLVNRGIVIKGNNTHYPPCCYTSFGSAYSADNTVIPFIRAAFAQGPCLCFLPNSDITYTAKVFPAKNANFSGRAGNGP